MQRGVPHRVHSETFRADDGTYGVRYEVVIERIASPTGAFVMRHNVGTIMNDALPMLLLAAALRVVMTPPGPTAVVMTPPGPTAVMTPGGAHVAVTEEGTSPTMLDHVGNPVPAHEVQPVFYPGGSGGSGSEG